MNFIETMKSTFNAVADHILNQLTAGEEATLNLHAEESLFVRFNNNKVRQNTDVEQRSLSLVLQKAGKTATVVFTLTGDTHQDCHRADEWLNWARKEVEELPLDPFQVPIQNNGTSDFTLKGSLLSPEEVIHAITEPAQGADLAGLYTAGPIISATRNSKGQSHWFATENFFIDYSLYNGQKAVKGVYAGTQWNQDDFAVNLAQSKNQLALMARPKKVIAPGSYRTYLAPAAVAEMATMFSWGALSYNNYKQGGSALQKLADGETTLSPHLSMRENFALGLTHRFNSLGELSAEQVDLIKNGQLATFLINSRSAKEYGVTSNGAESSEGPRSLEILPGSLRKENILRELGTGLYLSNLHYLNWSDRLNARITGMTRYACFWVENGEIVAPIADLRFDESLYDCLGANLLAVTDFQEVEPQVSTYESRVLGGSRLPGFLIKDFKFTL